MNRSKPWLCGTSKDKEANNGLKGNGIYETMESDSNGLNNLRENNNGLKGNGISETLESDSNGLNNLRENNNGLKGNGISENMELEFDNSGYDTDPDYRMYLKSLRENNNEISEKSMEHEDGNSGYDTDPEYRMYLKSLKENNDGVAESMEREDGNSGYDTDPEYRMYLKSLKENSDGVAESMEREDGNSGYDTDPDYRMYLKSLTENIIEISESSEHEDGNDEDYIDTDTNIHLKSTRGKFIEISEATEYNLVESNNTEKFPLGLITRQCQNDLVEPKKGKEDGERSYDTEMLVMNDALGYGEGNFSSCVSSKVHHAHLDSEGGNWQCSKNMGDKARSKFREEVMAVYQKSYDQGELDKLLKEVKLQKPVTGWRNLRERLVSFPTDRSSKSYLDHYPDLKTELDRVSLDQPKMLNTLRGFFYWLKNLSREGAFKPWLDPLCQDVTPRQVFSRRFNHSYSSHFAMINSK